jgi:hypothetical protein
MRKNIEMTKNNILKVLPKLSQDDLKQIRTRLDFLLQVTNKVSQLEDKKIFYDIMSNIIYQKTGNKPLYYNIFITTKHKKFLDHAFSFINKYFDNITTNIKIKKSVKITKQKFYVTFAKITIAYLIKIDVPISVSSVLKCVEKFPGLLNSEFPGYIEANLIEKIL